jgi:DNA-binding LacI/PurR family transcriptional regulator
MAAETEPAPHVPVMADVARVAGVSHQTVSRVINGSPNIRPSTRERVQAAIEQLGYRPNLAARALVTRRTHMIGVVVTGGGEYGPSSIQRSVEAAARQAGYFVSAVSLSEVTRSSLSDAVDHMLRQSVEGVVVIAAERQALDLVSERDPGVPLVVVEGDLSRGPFAVGVDQARGAYEATQHLVGLGHTRIAHVSGRAGWTEAEAREEGWRQALSDAGLLPGPLMRGDWTAARGYEIGCQLAGEPDVTGVFSANDQTAIGLLRAFHENGRTVPDDVSVVGFDDTPEAAFLVPPLTTVRQEFPLVGRRAIDVLHAAITGQQDAQDRLIDPVLVVRASSGPAPSTRTRRRGAAAPREGGNR